MKKVISAILSLASLVIILYGNYVLWPTHQEPYQRKILKASWGIPFIFTGILLMTIDSIENKGWRALFVLPGFAWFAFWMYAATFFTPEE